MRKLLVIFFICLLSCQNVAKNPQNCRICQGNSKEGHFIKNEPLGFTRIDFRTEKDTVSWLVGTEGVIIDLTHVKGIEVEVSGTETDSSTGLQIVKVSSINKKK